MVMTTGYGELSLLKRFNLKWGERGHCIRLQQRKGSPAVISDLIAGINRNFTYSIEVKKILNRRQFGKYTKTRSLSFTTDFSIATSKIEFQHQLERQVQLSWRMGWIPLLLLQVVSPGRPNIEYLMHSTDLYTRMKRGDKSVSSDEFEALHDDILYDLLFKKGVVIDD